MVVGTIVKLKRECLDNPPGTRGVCYEIYDRGKGEEGVSIIFENGKCDGFSLKDREILFPIGISEDLMNYKYENISKVNADFWNGIFNRALVITKPKDKDQ
ncbi:MAG: hypothetical protein Q7W45_14625 [Bacteroidota bacterium]|nr:hypothetical protein [Bacteroidota bacterium]MDP3147398.1 hypothetical protein [Bacteroidota bacterium]